MSEIINAQVLSRQELQNFSYINYNCLDNEPVIMLKKNISHQLNKHKVKGKIVWE